MQQSHCARALACALASFGGTAAAQDGVIHVTPLYSNETSVVQPAGVLRGDELRRRLGAGIGDTLDREPGVHAGGMGPGASRPVIRGQDAPRVRVLDNGLGSMDASSISPDHMPAVQTLGVTQVEVLRGPATLIHGGGAIGGVVNVVTRRIPRERRESVSGTADFRLGGPGSEYARQVELDGGAGAFAWHLDAQARDRGDYAAARGRVANSFLESRALNAGAAYVGERGHLGLGVQQLSSFYGVPAGELARIDLEQRRTELAGELRDPLPGFARLRVRLGRNDYNHREIEQTGDIATRFANNGSEGRVELAHRAVGPFTGVLGVTGQARRFSAVGAESFLAPTRSRGSALFVVEEARVGNWRFELGGRVERERHRPEGGQPARDETARTRSAGASWTFRPGTSLEATLTQARRVPAIEELYANGPHAATATFEVGDAGLRRERSRNLDLAVRQSSGAWRWKAGIYANRFRDYVYGHALGRVDDTGAPDPAGEFTRVEYRQADARFRGYEAELAYRPQSGLGGRLFADASRGRLEGVGNVPRMAPARVGGEATYTRGAWSAHASLLRVQRQGRIAVAQETETPGYTRLDAGLQYRILHAGGGVTTLYAQANNLLDEDMRVHTSYIKDAAPLPGRGLALGLRADF